MESQTAASGMYGENRSQDSQNLMDTGIPYISSSMVSPMASQIYPNMYRPGFGYHEAAAALFYNQLAAVHHLHQQRMFLGARNQLTESHAHGPPQNESAGLVGLQPVVRDK